MKISVLLPTRDRLELLKFAIETVRKQDYEDWEIIVSDNFSEQDISGYIFGLNDSRIKYFRTERFLPVTENWNNALSKSTGDYVIMLGDDDGLMKGYLRTIHELAISFRFPDFIYSGALLYAYPGVMPGRPEGFLQDYRYAPFFKWRDEPFVLEKEAAISLVKQSMNFWLKFGYNMQFAAISRIFIESLKEKGPFFQSPYPDYYAMNVMFLRAKKILIQPFPMVVIGISPKSFGSYYFNNKEEQGVEFLKNEIDSRMLDRLKDIIMPGTNMNTSWLVAMETVLQNYGEEFPLSVSYERYRLIQIFHHWSTGGIRKILSIWRILKFREKAVLGFLFFPFIALLKISPKSLRDMGNRKVNQMNPYFHEILPKEFGKEYKNMLEVFEGTSLIE